MGPLLSCLLSRQFRALRDGDRWVPEVPAPHVWGGVVTLSPSPEGSGGRGTACSPDPSGNASAPSPWPASSATTATSPGCPPTPSPTRRGWRTRCRAPTPSSPAWTCGRGPSRTRVRDAASPPPLLPRHPPQPQHAATSLSDPRCGPVPRIQSGHWLLCDSAVLYRCQAGFRRRGPPSISCDPASQQWSSAPPTCRGRSRWL